MNTSQKGFIAPLLLILTAVLLIGGGMYLYVQPQPANHPSGGDISGLGEILPHGYQPQTPYEKDLLDRLQQKLRSQYAGGVYANVVPALRYYDDNVVLYEFPLTQGYNLDIADVDTLSTRNTYADMYMQAGNYIQNETYIVAMEPVLTYPGAESTGEEQLVVYKKGADDFQPIEGSKLISSETYAQQDADLFNGPLLEGAIDDSKGTVSVSIFKDNPEAPHNDRVRVETFVLP